MRAVPRPSATGAFSPSTPARSVRASEPSDVSEGLWRGFLILGLCMTAEGVGLLVILSVGSSLALFDFSVIFVIGVMVSAYVESTDGVNAFGAATLASIVLALYFSVTPGSWGYLPGHPGSTVGWWTAGGLQVFGVALTVTALVRLAQLNAEPVG